MESAAFLGDRPERFTFKYHETDPLAQQIREALVIQAYELYSQGVKRFLCGPSPGVGFWAAEAVLELKIKEKSHGIILTCALPFEGYDRNWNVDDQRRYQKLLGACDTVYSASRFAPNPQNPVAISTAYKRRDYFLVDEAEHLVVVYDQDRSVRTQVGQAVNYAKSKGRSIRYIHPDTAEVQIGLLSK